jgi:hypothetical protein
MKDTQLSNLDHMCKHMKSTQITWINVPWVVSAWDQLEISKVGIGSCLLHLASKYQDIVGLSFHPRKAINCVSVIGCHQGMPDMITYANRQGCEIGDMAEEYPSNNDNDYESYQDSDQSDKEFETDHESAYDSFSSADWDSISSSDDDDDQGSDDEPKIQVGDKRKDTSWEMPRVPHVHVPVEPVLDDVDDAVTTNQPAENQGES